MTNKQRREHIAAHGKTSPAQPSQLQRSADAIARAVAAELPKHNPIERRELLTQMVRWLSDRLEAFDAAQRAQSGAVVVPTAQETQIVTGAFGKGCRTSDTIAVV